MSVDKETKPSYVGFTLTNDEEIIKKAVKYAEEEGINSKENELLSLNSLNGKTDVDEYYYNEKDNEISISGSYSVFGGEATFYISIPLSDAVLIDILATSVKRLNKLKTVLEAIRWKKTVYLCDNCKSELQYNEYYYLVLKRIIGTRKKTK